MGRGELASPRDNSSPPTRAPSTPTRPRHRPRGTGGVSSAVRAPSADCPCARRSIPRASAPLPRAPPRAPRRCRAETGCARRHALGADPPPGPTPRDLPPLPDPTYSVAQVYRSKPARAATPSCAASGPVSRNTRRAPRAAASPKTSAAIPAPPGAAPRRPTGGGRPRPAPHSGCGPRPAHRFLAPQRGSTHGGAPPGWATECVSRLQKGIRLVAVDNARPGSRGNFHAGGARIERPQADQMRGAEWPDAGLRRHETASRSS